jgi:hypothetical protein
VRRTLRVSLTAISFIGDFRTPGAVRAVRHPPPASENLHNTDISIATR